MDTCVFSRRPWANVQFVNRCRASLEDRCEQITKQQHAQHAHHLSMNGERALLYTCSSCLTPHWLKIWVLSFHLHSHPWAHLLESLLLFYFHLSFPVFFSFHLLHCELYSELDNLIAMESLCYSAKGSDDAYDVSVSLTGYEPNFMAFSELNDSSGSFSYIIPSSDQDMDDVTLGKLLTEAHRGQADYCNPKGVSVSQSSSSVVFDGSGKPEGERDVDQ